MRLFQLSLCILVSICFACGNEPSTSDQNIGQIEVNERKKDSVKALWIDHKSISEPITWNEIYRNKSIDYTSGGSRKDLNETFCDSNIHNGFYGAYHLIDRRIPGNPIGPVGLVNVFALGEMLNWKASDSNQIIWRIQLESDVITLWDSIKIGLPRNTIKKFASANNSILISKSEYFSYIDFGNFMCVFNFEDDTLIKMTIERRCL